MLITPQNSAAGGPYSADLAGRLVDIRERMTNAAVSAGRDVRSVTLLAVSKGQDISRIRAAQALGLTDFGENYVDEALPKIRAVNSGAVWHFIGRLQGNKTRVVAENFAWVHGVDRLRIAERLSAQRPFHAPPLNICIQVHIAADPAKGGVMAEELLPLLLQVAPMPRLKLRGLMCMLPYAMAAADQVAAFRQLAVLAQQARTAGLPLDTLSMGMSADFEAAIEAGATIVRIGTALFGARD
jgi:pyridoxal phosphate enzyme (YggS family)